MNTIEQKVRVLIADLLQIDIAIVTGDLALREDLGADSLDLAELIVTLSKTFAGTTIFDRQVQSIKTVGEIVTYIQECQPVSTSGQKSVDRFQSMRPLIAAD